jgi:hypothetical protein
MRAVKSLAKGNSKQLYSGHAAQRRRPGFSFRVTLAQSVRSHSGKYFVCFYIALTQYQLSAHFIGNWKSERLIMGIWKGI